VNGWRCPGCGYLYDEQHGHPREGFPAGTPWREVPDDWACPDCGVYEKIDFEQAHTAPDSPADLLRGEDCDSGQGFLFARPLDVAATETFLASTFVAAASPSLQPPRTT
jgi:rubredoxin